MNLYGKGMLLSGNMFVYLLNLYAAQLPYMMTLGDLQIIKRKIVKQFKTMQIKIFHFYMQMERTHKYLLIH